MTWEESETRVRRTLLRVAETLGGRTAEELAEVLSLEEFWWWADEFRQRAEEETEAARPR